MAEVVKVEEQFAIVSEMNRPTTLSRVLKHGDSFAVFDAHGDIDAAASGEQGVYHGGTRFLSRLQLLLGGRQPVLLSSTISEDNTVFTADLTNPDVVKDSRVVLGRGVIHLFRSRVLCDGSWIECLRISNHGLHPIEAPLSDAFWTGFGLGAGTVLAAAGVVAGIAALT